MSSVVVVVVVGGDTEPRRRDVGGVQVVYGRLFELLESKKSRDDRSPIFVACCYQDKARHMLVDIDIVLPC